AQHRRAPHRARHLHRRRSHHSRGDPVVPRHRHPARNTQLGQHHGRGPHAVPRVPPQHPLSRHLPCTDGDGHQHHGGRAARHARSEDEQESMTASALPSLSPTLPRQTGEVARKAAGGPVLEVRNLTVALPPGADRANAVETVSFTVNPGEIVCLVGESGSGKSVIAFTIMGLLAKALRPTSGEIVLEGENVLAADEARLRELRCTRMSMIFQEPMTALNPVMTCGEQIDEVLETHTKLDAGQRKAKILAILERVKLPEPERIYASYPHQLSGGQRQRIMIAMALVLDPVLLIAD